MRARLVNFGRTFAAVVALGANAACATIGAGQPAHSDVPVETGEQEQPSGETVDVEQSGTMLTLRSHKLCDVHETREVSRTTTTPRENKSAWVDWTLGLGGAALAGAGVATMADSGNVGTTDQTSKTYNPVGGTGAIAVGVGLIALGIAGGTVAIVDAVRVGGSDESKARVSLPGRELRHGVACKTPVPVANVELALLLPRARGEKDERIALGKTGSEGILRVDLERALPDDLGRSAKAHVMRRSSVARLPSQLRIRERVLNIGSVAQNIKPLPSMNTVTNHASSSRTLTPASLSRRHVLHPVDVAVLDTLCPARSNNPTALPARYDSAFEVRSRRNKRLGFVARVVYTRLLRPVYTRRSRWIVEWWAFDRDLRRCQLDCKCLQDAVDAVVGWA